MFKNLIAILLTLTIVSSLYYECYFVGNITQVGEDSSQWRAVHSIAGLMITGTSLGGLYIVYKLFTLVKDLLS